MIFNKTSSCTGILFCLKSSSIEICFFFCLFVSQLFLQLWNATKAHIGKEYKILHFCFLFVLTLFPFFYENAIHSRRGEIFLFNFFCNSTFLSSFFWCVENGLWMSGLNIYIENFKEEMKILKKLNFKFFKFQIF